MALADAKCSSASLPPLFVREYKYPVGRLLALQHSSTPLSACGLSLPCSCRLPRCSELVLSLISTDFHDHNNVFLLLVRVGESRARRALVRSDGSQRTSGAHLLKPLAELTLESSCLQITVGGNGTLTFEPNFIVSAFEDRTPGFASRDLTFLYRRMLPSETSYNSYSSPRTTQVCLFSKCRSHQTN